MSRVNGAVERLRAYWRARRMQRFRATVGLRDDWHILDVGGTPHLWSGPAERQTVTLLNLPSIAAEMEASIAPTRHVMVGDICRMPDIARSYDLVFSNSVLEHVGSLRRQQQFAAIVRSAKAYWVQVPAPTFPIEVHCRYLFWWLLPSGFRRKRIRAWKRTGRPFLGRQMAGTRPIDRKLLRRLFPDGEIATERFLGITKSYYVWRVDPVEARRTD
jgi:hypothetical protein